MKNIVLYSKKWAEKKSHEELFNKMKARCDKNHIDIFSYGEFLSIPLLKDIIRVAENGFDDVVRRGLVPSIQYMLYSECINWIMSDIDYRLISCIGITLDDEMKVKQVYLHLWNIDYMVDLIENYN